VLNMRIATTESYLDRNKVRQERTDWHNVVLWGKRGEALAKFLTKGSTVFIEGGLRTSTYDDKEGKKRYKTEVVATNLILAGGRGRGGGGPDMGDEPSGGGGGGRRGGGGGGGPSAPPDDSGPSAPPDDFGGGDDIPF